MNSDNEKRYFRIHKTALLIIVLMVVAGILGWKLGQSDKPATSTPTNNVSAPLAESTTASPSDVSSLVSYTLPDGWEQTRCEGSGAVYVIPNGSATADCKANPVSLVKISVDPGNNTDCNQLQNQSEVKKHICISLYINGHKTLKATTEYLASSSYKQATTMNAYYMDTGNGVVKLEYWHSTDNQYERGFDQLANSLKSKQ